MPQNSNSYPVDRVTREPVASDPDCLHCQIGELIRRRLDDEGDELDIEVAANDVAQVFSDIVGSLDDPADKVLAVRYMLRHLGLDWSAEHAASLLRRRASS